MQVSDDSLTDLWRAVVQRAVCDLKYGILRQEYFDSDDFLIICSRANIQAHQIRWRIQRFYRKPKQRKIKPRPEY